MELYKSDVELAQVGMKFSGAALRGYAVKVAWTLATTYSVEESFRFASLAFPEDNLPAATPEGMQDTGKRHLLNLLEKTLPPSQWGDADQRFFDVQLVLFTINDELAERGVEPITLAECIKHPDTSAYAPKFSKH